jgi:hypothetical protein
MLFSKPGGVGERFAHGPPSSEAGGSPRVCVRLLRARVVDGRGAWVQPAKRSGGSGRARLATTPVHPAALSAAQPGWLCACNRAQPPGVVGGRPGPSLLMAAWASPEGEDGEEERAPAARADSAQQGKHAHRRGAAKRVCRQQQSQGPCVQARGSRRTAAAALVRRRPKFRSGLGGRSGCCGVHTSGWTGTDQERGAAAASGGALAALMGLGATR